MVPSKQSVLTWAKPNDKNTAYMYGQQQKAAEF